MRPALTRLARTIGTPTVDPIPTSGTDSEEEEEESEKFLYSVGDVVSVYFSSLESWCQGKVIKRQIRNLKKQGRQSFYDIEYDESCGGGVSWVAPYKDEIKPVEVTI